ncbi:DUF1203 domain-containing protein [Streptomyces sp. NPDC088090]|uniref:DUF1203 domain-containing protein n=1 Tax=Streptomyces sp. NPDC088090 TaxID=3365822 RepID=UPI00384BB44A
MDTFTPRAVEPAALAALRDTDDAGRPLRPYTAEEGGEPLRCCLRRARPGESVALVSYAPLRRWAAATGAAPGAYDEVGPVFVHAEECAGPEERKPSEPYPFERAGVLRTVRRYGADGRILGGRLVELPGLDEAFTEAFADPAVALVHVRAVEYGCFLFEVRRP